MRKGFTLIELMIVIAIIAIIAAIAIPNLMESRISSNEAAAASTLKSGINAAQAQFQSSKYSDSADDVIYGMTLMGGASMPTNTGGDGTPDYAATFNQLAGGIAALGTSNTVPAATDTAVNLLPRFWSDITAANFGGIAYQTQIGTNATTVAGPTNSGYVFALIGGGTWYVATCAPRQTDGTVGRRKFAINQLGAIFATNPSNQSAVLAMQSCLVPFGATIPFTTPAVAATPAWSPLK